MIGYLRGKVKELTREFVLLDVNGVGYEVACSSAAFSRLSGAAEGEVYTYLQVKEDGVALYGFADLQEKALFLKLISVQNVGAKSAMAMLASMRPDEIMNAIQFNDSKRLSAVKGLGKKTAERIILELNGKLTAEEVMGSGSAPVRAAAPSEEDDDAVAALMGLGFTKQESARAVERAKNAGAATVEEILALALRGL